jgi:hypothetical protein
VTKVRAHGGEELVNVEAFDLLVDVDVVLVKDLWVVEGLQDGGLEGIGEVGKLVGRLEAADEGLKALLFAEVPVKEAEIRIGQRDGAWDVDCL